MKKHIKNCKRVLRGVSAFSVRNESLKHYQQSQTPTNKSLITLKDVQTTPVAVSSANQEEFNCLYALAVLETNTPFNLFYHLARNKSCKATSPSWEIPTASHICARLLNHSYEKCMYKSFEMNQLPAPDILGVDRATNRLSNSNLNFILHVPHSFFREFLHSNLKKKQQLKMLKIFKNSKKKSRQCLRHEFIFCIYIRLLQYGS